MKILTNYISTLVKSVVLIFALVGVVSCQKNKNDDPVIDPIGYWKGHYTQIGFIGQPKVNVLLKADGTARVYDMGVKTDTTTLSAGAKSSGVWLFTNGQLDVQYGPPASALILTGTVDPGNMTWIGSWSAEGVKKGDINLSKE